MAVVTFSAIISDLRGKLGNYVYSFQRGVHYIKQHNPSPYDPRTARQQEIRGFQSDLSASWSTLPETAKQMWNRYAGTGVRPCTGYMGFLGANMFIYSTGVAGLVRLDYPPLTPARPHHVEGFAVTADTPTQNTLSWTAPEVGVTYVQALRQFDWNYYSGYNQRWVQLDAVVSTDLQIVDSHTIPAGARVWYKLRSFDKYARRAPFTHVIRIVIPSV